MIDAKGSEHLKDETRYTPKASASEDQEELDVLWGAPGDFEHEVDPPTAQIREAQSLAGALNWLATRTRGDIAFGVSRMSSMSTLAPQRALALGKKILRYLIATPDVGLRMVQAGCAGGTPGTAGQPEEAATLRCYCDASFSPYGEHSFTGVCLMWRGSALLWRAVKQSMVAQSTAEAELLAMASGLQVAQAIQEVVNELGVWDTTQVTILGDNAAAIALAKNGGSWRSRHYAVKASALREAFRNEWATPQWVESEAQVADLMTKFTPPQTSRRLRRLAGMGGEWSE